MQMLVNWTIHKKSTYTMKNHVYEDHIALQLEFKNHSNTTMLQLCPPKVQLLCNYTL
jgi:hypothetical protein